MPEKLLNADTPEELLARLAELDIDVPSRGSGRLSQQVERYCVAHLLATLPLGRLRFPITLTHSDRPDFLLTTSSGDIGIEHTEAVPPNVANADAMRGRGLGPAIYFNPRATPGEARKTAAELRREMAEDEPGDGWIGDSAEREWADAMAHHVQEKLSKSTASGFVRHPSNWLIVYDNWPLPAIDLEKAVSFLSVKLAAMNSCAVFESIFVQSGAALIEFGKKQTIGRL